MWIVFLIIIYVIVAGVSCGVFLYYMNDDLSYLDSDDFQSAAIGGLFWPFTLPCGLVIYKLKKKEKESEDS